MDEQDDDIKHYNAMMMFAKVATIRDRQQNENKILEENWEFTQESRFYVWLLLTTASSGLYPLQTF